MYIRSMITINARGAGLMYNSAVFVVTLLHERSQISFRQRRKCASGNGSWPVSKSRKTGPQRTFYLWLCILRSFHPQLLLLYSTFRSLLLDRRSCVLEDEGLGKEEEEDVSY